MEYVHVNVNRIKSNGVKLREGAVTTLAELEPVVTAKPSRSETGVYGQRIAILDALGNEVAYVTYDPFHPLPCGAKAWIEAPHGTKVIA
jgi:hypothetical protein